MTGADLAYVAASGIAVATSILAVTRRNPVYSAVWLLLSFFAVGTIYLLLNATFLFVVQILLYAGAILVLFIFVVMLLNPAPADLEQDRSPVGVRAAAFLMALGIAGVLGWVTLRGDWGRGPFPGPVAPANFGETAWIGAHLYRKFLVVFEMVSIVICAAIAAVIVLAKRSLEPGTGGGIGERRPDKVVALIEEKPHHAPAETAHH
jgi:NADH-quinone oxidoreductase subunit J